MPRFRTGRIGALLTLITVFRRLPPPVRRAVFRFGRRHARRILTISWMLARRYARMRAR